MKIFKAPTIYDLFLFCTILSRSSQKFMIEDEYRSGLTEIVMTAHIYGLCL